jgi:hypothetical protein
MTALSVFTKGCVARSALGSEEDDVAGIRASKRWLGGKGLDQASLCAIVAPDHVAMKIVSSSV